MDQNNKDDSSKDFNTHGCYVTEVTVHAMLSQIAEVIRVMRGSGGIPVSFLCMVTPRAPPQSSTVARVVDGKHSLGVDSSHKLY